MDDSQSLREAVRRVLIHDWDPAGIGLNPDLHDEYDYYLPAICGSTASDMPEEELLDLLHHTTHEIIGVHRSREQLRPVVRKLLALRETWRSG